MNSEAVQWRPHQRAEETSKAARSFEAAPLRASRGHRWRALAVGGSAAMFVASGVPSAAAPTIKHAFSPQHPEESINNFALTERLAPRLADLQAMACEDGIELREASRLGLFGFIERFEVVKRPQLTLRDDGCLRALWRGNEGEELSVKFIEHADLHVALIIPRAGERPAQWAGFDGPEGVVDLVYGFDVPGLLFA